MTIDDATRRELSRFGFDEAQLDRFSARLRTNPDEAQQATFVKGAITPLERGDVSVLPAPGSAAHAALVERGRAALRTGEVGVVILAGGMATRFGGVVKAAVPVTQGKTFLGLKVADVAHLRVPVPIYVMTSFATHDRIDQQVRDERLVGVETFPQLVSVRLTPGGELFHEHDGSLSPYATGHGDLTFALRASGMLDKFRAGGGKLLFMSNVDNLGATLEPAIIGAHLAHGAAITAEVVRKEKGDKGGAPARLDGTPQIIEAFRFPPEFDQDSIPLFNTNTFVFDAAAIDRDFDLTFFRVEKKVGDSKVIQFERLVGQLTAFLPTHFLEVPRSGSDGRFQPVKDPEELEHRRRDIEEILRAKHIV
jgi:UTP--glucose-1-phosphate uridylyltransferase